MLTNRRHVLLGNGAHARSLVALDLVRPSATIDKGDEDKLGLFTGYDAVIAIGNNPTRHAVYLRAVAAGLHPISQVHPAAIVHPTARIGVNVIVGAGAIIEHDAVLNDHSQVAPGGIILGGAVLEEGAFVPAGVVVRPWRTVEAWKVATCEP